MSSLAVDMKFQRLLNKKYEMEITQQKTESRKLEWLFRPIDLSSQLTLPNRIVMAPMTRSMATDELVPTDAMAKYYARRGEAGLIITEATIVRPDGQGYANTPGIYSRAQIDGWRRVTEAVHDAGGRIFLQLWHVGRVSHPFFLGGKRPIAPSAVALSGSLPRRRDLEYGTPRELNEREIQTLIEDFAIAARNAMNSGFDGVEIHGANGYLIDQFLHFHSNRRTDGWGGDPERMARFPLAIVDAVLRETGEGRTGLRLSPGAYVHMNGDSKDAKVFQFLLSRLDGQQLAYVHAGIFDDKISTPRP